MKYSNMEFCKLCGHNYAVDSHIIPKFIFRWLKNSGTGRMRCAENFNVPTQDGIVEKLLCSKCEGIFSNAETYFANRIFYPIVNDNISEFEYNINFRYFIISVFWRVLKNSLFQEIQDTIWKDIILRTEKEWTDFLYLGKPIQTYNEIHLLMGVDVIKDGDNLIDSELNNEFIRYMGRGIDAGIPNSDDVCFMYVKFPRFLFIIPFGGIDTTKFKDSIIQENGIYKTNNIKIEEPTISGVFLNRVIQIKKIKNSISSEQMNKSRELFLKKQSDISEKDLGIINEYIEKHAST